MGYTGARVGDAVGRLSDRLGNAFMRIGARQDRDAEMEAERVRLAAQDAEDRRRYDDGRRLQLESMGYQITDPASNPLGQAMMNAGRATGVATPSFMVGQRDPTRSFAYQDERALDKARQESMLGVAETSMQNLFSGPNDISNYTTLPDHLRTAMDERASAEAFRIIAESGGDRARAFEEASKLAGPGGVLAQNRIYKAFGERALDEATDNEDINWQLAQGIDPETNKPIVAQVHPRTGQVRPVDIMPKSAGAGGGQGTMQERLNEKLGNTAAYANQMLDQVDTALTGVAAGVAARPGRLSGLANMVTDDRSQAAGTAALNFINPAVRYLSGAQMNEQEAQRYYAAMIPRMGDNPRTVEMKRAMRRALIQAMGTGEWMGQPNPDGTPNVANADAFMADFMAKYGQQGAAPGPRSVNLPDDPDAAAEMILRGGR